MSNLGKGIYDDQSRVSASLIPNKTGLDIGSVEAPFRNLYVENVVDGGVTVPTGPKAGTVVVNGATPVAVATVGFVAGSSVIFSLKTVGGTVGAAPHLVTATPGVGFSVAATALDTSTYNWIIIDQA